MHVGCAGNLAHAARDLLGDVVILSERSQRPDNLHVDRRGQSEVQNLADDIGGLEKERQLGKLAAQLAPHFANVIPRGAVFSGFNDTRISPSNEPSVTLSVKARLKPL